MNKKSLIIILTVLILFAIYSFILNKINVVKLSQICIIDQKTEFDTEPYWIILTEKSEKELKYYDLDKEIFDFSKYNIVLSFGRKIRQMKYTRIFPFEKSNRVVTIVSKEFIPNKLYIYSISKNKKVYLDQKALTLDHEIIIED